MGKQILLCDITIPTPFVYRYTSNGSLKLMTTAEASQVLAGMTRQDQNALQGNAPLGNTLGLQLADGHVLFTGIFVDVRL